jgi:hypothetical protein
MEIKRNTSNIYKSKRKFEPTLNQSNKQKIIIAKKNNLQVM